MNLAEHYDHLYENAVREIEKDCYQVDRLIDAPDDKRFGLTLLMRPPEKVKRNIQKFIAELRNSDPSQYYYPDADIHVTVLSIISCYDGFRLSQIAYQDYSALVRKSMQTISRFEIEFKGITASESGIMLQGFPKNDMLTTLRNTLRSNFKNTALEQSIDKRYSIQTAHATVVRFRNALQNKKGFLETLDRYRHYDFGNSEIENLELVFNDWYQREENTIVLERFAL